MSRIEINYWRLEQYLDQLSGIKVQLQAQLLNDYVTQLHFIKSKSTSSQLYSKIMTLIVSVANKLMLYLDDLIVVLAKIISMFQRAESLWVTHEVK